jgi:polyhydroxyalkanoate depolymerase
VHSDVLAPIRLMAEFFRGVLTQPWPLIEDAPLVRGAAAAMELLSNAGMSHDRPDFGINSVEIDGEKVAVTEEVVASRPFCNLLHFRKEGIHDEPTVLVVAPLSGHFATLLRGTVRTLLSDHNVYITECSASVWAFRSRRFCRFSHSLYPVSGPERARYGGMPALGPGARGRVIDGGCRR